jgi:hypothetical protein
MMQPGTRSRTHRLRELVSQMQEQQSRKSFGRPLERPDIRLFALAVLALGSSYVPALLASMGSTLTRLGIRDLASAERLMCCARPRDMLQLLAHRRHAT